MSEPFWRLHIDYGTGNISAEYILCRRKADGTIMKIGGSVVFKNRETFAPAKYAWTNEGVFVWGCQLETLIREHKIAPGKVLKSFKTLLVDKHDHTAVVRSCLKRIYTSEDDIEDVLYASLKAIINDIRLYVRTRNKQCDLTPAQIDDLYVELSIGVPNEITIESIRLYEGALDHLRDAPWNVRSLVLCRESQCASMVAIALIKQELEWKAEASPTQQVKEILLTLDIGAGTSEADVLEIVFHADGRHESVRLGVSDGIVFGMDTSNMEFTRHFQHHDTFEVDGRSFKQLCEYLEFSANDLIAAAGDAFKIEKTDPEFEEGVDIVLTLDHADPADARSAKLVVPWEWVKYFLGVPIKKVVALAQNQIKKVRDVLNLHDIIYVIVPSACHANPFVQKELRELEGTDVRVHDAFRTVDDFSQRASPVARALAQHADALVMHHDLSQYNIAVEHRTEFDPIVHKDIKSGKYIGTTPVYGQIFRDANDGCEIVMGRALWVFKGKSMWQMHVVQMGATVIESQTFATTKPEAELKQDDPLFHPTKRIQAGTTWERRSHIIWWKRFRIAVPDLPGLGYHLAKDENGNDLDYFLVRVRFDRVDDGDGITMQVDRAETDVSNANETAGKSTRSKGKSTGRPRTQGARANTGQTQGASLKLRLSKPTAFTGNVPAGAPSANATIPSVASEEMETNDAVDHWPEVPSTDDEVPSSSAHGSSRRQSTQLRKRKRAEARETPELDENDPRQNVWKSQKQAVAQPGQPMTQRNAPAHPSFLAKPYGIFSEAEGYGHERASSQGVDSMALDGRQAPADPCTSIRSSSIFEILTEATRKQAQTSAEPTGQPDDPMRQALASDPNTPEPETFLRRQTRCPRRVRRSEAQD